MPALDKERQSGDRPRNRSEALQAVAARVGGAFEVSNVTGGYAVRVPHGARTLTLDLHLVSSGTASTMHTRVVTHFTSRSDLKLLVRRRTFMDRVLSKFGVGGTAHLGRDMSLRYVVRGRPGPRVRSVLSGGLADAMRSMTSTLRVEVGRAPRKQRKLLGPGARTLQVLAPGVDTGVVRMVDLIGVARKAIDVLERSGVASPAPTR